MKLLIVAPEFPPAVGGMEAHSWHVATHLIARGHGVTVVTQRSYRTQRYELSGTVRPILGGRFLPDLWRLRSVVRAERPDAILVLNAGYAVLGRLVACPVVCRTVGNDVYNSWAGPHLPLRFLFWRLPYQDRRAVGRWWRRQDQRVRNACVLWGLRSSRSVLANSQFTARTLAALGLGHPRVDVLVGGVDVSLFQPSPPGTGQPASEGTFVLLTVANLLAKKGIDTSLRAVALLVGRYPQLQYRIAGGGDDRPRLEALARTLGIAQHVCFVGNRAPAEVAALLREAHVYVHSSRTVSDPITGCPDVETMGRAVCEANAAGVPVVVTASGGLPDVVRHNVNALIVPEADPEALARAIEQLLQDPALRQRIAAAGVELARGTFAWSVVADRTEQALVEACAAGRRESGAQARLQHVA